jgi:hypothetical protein
MDKAMTPSTDSKTTTTGQIDKAVANYRAMLEKHAGEFNSEEVQFVLGQQELANEQFAFLRERVEAVGGIIRRRVVVRRNRTQQEMLDATGRVQYINSEVVGLIPGKGETEEEEDMYFIPLKGKDTSAEAVQTLLDQCGLKPDGYAVSAVNEADPSFAASHPNCTQWVDADGKHCYIAFFQWDDGGRRVHVYRIGGGWGGGYCVGGVRK